MPSHFSVNSLDQVMHGQAAFLQQEVLATNHFVDIVSYTEAKEGHPQVLLLRQRLYDCTSKPFSLPHHQLYRKYAFESNLNPKLVCNQHIRHLSHASLISRGLAKGSISVMGRPKAILGKVLAKVSIIVCKTNGAVGSCHILSKASWVLVGSSSV